MFGLRRRKQSNRKQPPQRTARRLFHGVAIRPAETPCAAAAGLANVRYLADEAPMLPLADCSNPAGCRCTYEHFDDRRTQARRDSDVGMPPKSHPKDVRTGWGRRVTDG